MAVASSHNLASTAESMRPPTESRTISVLGNICARSLDRLLESSHSLGDVQYVQSLEDECGRFRVWAANIGALQPERSASSLDSRLRDTQKQRESVVLALERLQNVIIRCQSIISGQLPNRTAPEGPGDWDKRTSELEQLMINLHSSINSLFSLSTLIRRRRPRGRLPKPDGFVPLENSPDIKHVEDKFPKVRSTPWLARRLGNAITQRRQMIQYRQSHRGRLATVTPEGNAEGAPSKIFETVATTYEERAEGEIGGPRDRRSMFTSATSFVSSYGNDLGRRIPDLPDMTLEGVQLGYREPIECPYCRTIQVLVNRAEWRRHVFSDLQPYVCTFKDCISELFETRQEWFSHEINTHRQDWVCIHCNDSKMFHSLSALKRHLGVQHANELTDSQLETMLEACQCAPKRIDSGECPLCDEWAPPAVESQNVKQFCRHLARHQQMLALEALPISVEGLELKAAASDSDDNQDPEDEGPRMKGCTECGTIWSEDGHGSECPLCYGPGYVVRLPSSVTWPSTSQDDFDIPSGLPEGWQDMIASEGRLYFVHGAAVWPERHLPVEGQELRPVDETQVSGDTQQGFSGIFYTALPVDDEPEERPENAGSSHDTQNYNVLWIAASRFEFNIATVRLEAGYPFLMYQCGEIFDVIAEKGELWLARNQDDPTREVGWIWSKHFAKLPVD